MSFKIKSFILLSCAFLLFNCNEKDVLKTESSNFNLDWDFYLSQEDLKIGAIPNEKFKSINLPHDWAVENEFDSTLVNDALATGYLASKGYGYYRKKFDKVFDVNEVTYVHFDGVYNNATIYINNHELGFHPYGYSPFYYDISKFLNKEGKSNILEVKIDHTRYADSRWYTGAGIYRKVELITSNKLHIPVWGTYVTTPNVSKEKATVQIEVSVKNGFAEDEALVLKTIIKDANNTEVATAEEHIKVKGNNMSKALQSIEVSNPKLWNTSTPNLYKAVSVLLKNGEKINSYTTTFGIRDIKFDANTGFFLNGENMKIKGVCLHHDAGMVGSAVPKGVWKRRFQILKDGGCNAIRISHNPGSTEFLDLCDEMGILVQDEFFDEWDNPKDKRHNKNEEKSTDYITRGYGEHFQKWAHKDLETTMLSHRNHPSIIQWSIGNEIEWTYPKNAAATGFFNNMDWKGNYFWSEPPHSVKKIKEMLDTYPAGKYDIGKTANKLSRWTKELDLTRPVVANCILPSSSHLSGYGDALDIVGYSYRRVLYDYGHKNYPDKPIMGTENLAQYHEWKSIMERPHISGTFLWTGIDYMGEIRDKWPVRVQPSGMLNTAGFTKGSYHMMKTLWNDDAHIHIATQNIKKSLNKIDKSGQIVAKDPEKWKHALWEWQDVNNHWNYEDKEMISVEIYSNCEEIELFLNDKSLGLKKLSDFEDHIYKWGVPFSNGSLVAKGKKGGKEIVSKLITAKVSHAITMTADVETISANHEDVSHVVVQLVDENGNPSKTDDKIVEFQIEGDLKLLGVDNGWKKSVQKFQSSKGNTHEGRLLLIVQAKGKKGVAKITATSEGLKTSSLDIALE